MSSHRRSTKYFSRKKSAREALFKGLMISLVEHGRIKTTVDKAKELRRHIERAVTLCKRQTLNSRRLAESRLGNPDAAESLFKEIAPRFAERAGGYTRVIKIGRRPGDTAEMAFIEWSDFDYSKFTKVTGKAKKGEEAKKTKEEMKEEKAKKVADSRAREAHRKSVARMQKKSRQIARLHA